jgi:hypothetical protein
MCVMVEVNGEFLDMLVRLHWLRDAEAGDKRMVGRAIAAMLEDAARR